MYFINLAIALSSLLELVSPDYIIMNDKDDFPMGMGYDEAYNIERLKPKRTFFKTITSYRLPRVVMPVHYDVYIKPILEDPQPGEELFTAPGHVDITITVVEITYVITLHAKQVRIIFDSIKVTPKRENATHPKVTGHNIDEERSFLTIFLDTELTEGAEYNLHIDFVSIVNKPEVRLAGLYAFSYQGKDGEEKWGAMTQFQKDDASRAFPCFDEPDMKAVFAMRIGRKADRYMSMGTMARAGDPVPINGSDGWVWDIFEPTPKYSTYLITFAVVQDYVGHESPKGRLPSKAWAPISKMTNESAKFAAEVARNTLDFFEEFFDFKLDFLNKMDTMASSQIEPIGMEHPGLATFQYKFLLWQKEEDPLYELYSAVSITSHELIHQWLGNLVTCKWWNDFWLNEAFTRYFQFIGTDKNSINFRAKERDVLDLVQWAMDFDESPDTVPIRSNETDRVQYLPFHIEYEKGASIVRMMSTIITEPVFFTAIRRYLKKYQFQSVTQNEMFAELQEAANEEGIPLQYPLATLMKPYLTKTGFPIIMVHRTGTNKIYLTQQRFTVHPSNNNKFDPGLWYVPIWLITKSNPEFDPAHTPPMHIMEPEAATYSFKLNNTDDWVIINPNVRGYYRVIYDKASTELIVKQLLEDHTVIPFQTRAQLFDDYFRCAKARYNTIGHALSLTKYLEKEDEYIVWTTVLNNFRRTFLRHLETSLVQKFKKFFLKKIEPPFKRLGSLRKDWEPTNVIMYSMFFEWMCTLDDESCTNLVTEYMTEWMENPDKNPVIVDIQPVVYCAAVKICETNKTREFFISQLAKGPTKRQQSYMSKALACDRNEDNLKILLNAVLNEGPADISITGTRLVILTSMAGNPTGREVLWDAIKTKADTIEKMLGPDAIPEILGAFSYYVSNRGTGSYNKEFLDFAYDYLEDHHNITRMGQYKLENAIQRSMDNSFFLDYGYHDVEAFINRELIFPTK